MVTMAWLGGLTGIRWQPDLPLYNPGPKGLSSQSRGGCCVGGWVPGSPCLMTKAQGSTGVRWVLGRRDAGLRRLDWALWGGQGFTSCFRWEVCPQRASGVTGGSAQAGVVWTEPGVGIGKPGPKAVMTPCDPGQGLTRRRQPGSDFSWTPGEAVLPRAVAEECVWRRTSGLPLTGPSGWW